MIYSTCDSFYSEKIRPAILTPTVWSILYTRYSITPTRLLARLTQCTANDRLAPKSWWIVTASSGEQCCSFMNHAGS